MPSELSTWQNAVSGATAGVVARFVIAPLDVVKIRFQLQTDKKYTSVLQSLRLIVKEEGIFGLFKGNLPAEYLYLTYSAIQFLCYYELDKKMKQTDLSTQTRAFIAGSTAGAIATFITYPLDLLRTRFAIQADGNQRMYPSMLGAIRQIYAAEGLKGFYRGCKPSVLQIMPYMGVMFTAHSIVRDSLKRGKSFSKSADFIAGGVAGIIAKTAVMPFDVVRFSRITKSENDSKSRDKVVHDTFWQRYPTFLILCHSLELQSRLQGQRAFWPCTGGLFHQYLRRLQPLE